MSEHVKWETGRHRDNEEVRT
ncbi:MAG: hypothetical protein JWN52_2169, partial [Actinomycetia bacterium]|nr:hypothetical protein [Actinomycetes bacterium]